MTLKNRLIKHLAEQNYRAFYNELYSFKITNAQDEKGHLQPQKLLIKFLVGSNKKVLELGCGMGDLSSHLSKSNKVVGVDFSSVAIRYANQHKNSNSLFFVQDITTLQLKQTFDYVVCSDFIEHISKKDLADLLKKIKKDWLKRSGRLIIWTFSKLYADRQPTHVIEYSLGELMLILKKGGFPNIRLYHPYFAFLGLIFKFPSWSLSSLLFYEEITEKTNLYKLLGKIKPLSRLLIPPLFVLGELN